MNTGSISTTTTQRWLYLLPLTAVLIWAINIVVTRYAVDLIEPISISFYRWLIAWLVLTPFMLLKVIRRWQDIRPHLWQLAVLGFLGMVCYQGLAYTAAHYTTATNMGIINAFIPVFSIFFSIFILKIYPNRFAIFGVILSIFGLMYLVTQGNFATLLHGQHIFGDLLMVLAVGLYAFYGIFLQRWQLRLPLFIMLYIQVIFAVLFHIPLIMYFGLDQLNAANAPAVFYAGIFSSIFAAYLWMMAVQNLGSNRTSIFMNFIPIFTAIIAYIFLHEQWTIYHSIGGAMVLVGILLAQKK
ncbi:DMT family transporter [Acinetobacter populi]|jgi:drug/metabolite transporter (DMT)-like permease|uniref:EamA family transporter n=1 Tax=Acinetobacter populi TaxID=1582270 RepID=A0A1Z9Z3B2_9GAMM|nr:DMT family transporter [Acinetobacter populi]MCH4246704.1 DMT family transporter [Acinetobacter populi]OUY08917.1 EamA family transporter [Acinetobacter populi]